MSEPQGILGEVLAYGARVRTAPYTDELRAGDAIDAGIVQILDSNLSHLSRELLHQLGTAIGSDSALEQKTSYSGLEDVDTPTNAQSVVDVIAWTRAVSFCWGPFDLTQDRIGSDGATQMRSVTACVDAIGGTASSLTLIVAVTQGPGIPRSDNVIGYASASASSGRAQNQLTATVGPVAFGQRRARADGSEFAAFADLWVWVGWLSTSGTDRIIAADAWESR
jgi:hypothetical protein